MTSVIGNLNVMPKLEHIIYIKDVTGSVTNSTHHFSNLMKKEVPENTAIVYEENYI